MFGPIEAAQLDRIERLAGHINRRNVTMAVNLEALTRAVRRVGDDVKTLLAARHDDSAAAALQASLDSLTKTLDDTASAAEADLAPAPQPVATAPAPEAPAPDAAPNAAGPTDASPAPVAAASND